MLYYYVTHPCEGITTKWMKVVSGPFIKKEDLEKAVCLLLSSADNDEICYLLNYFVVASMKKVDEGRSLLNNWITDYNIINESKSIKVQTVISEILAR